MGAVIRGLLQSFLRFWRWTQVLNMKPAEILGMLEEAAGTRMYETKKDAALRTLEKKQVKVSEIEKVGAPLSVPLPLTHDVALLEKNNVFRTLEKKQVKVSEIEKVGAHPWSLSAPASGQGLWCMKYVV